MSPLMSRVAEFIAEFMQCDITYDQFREYSYIFNAVVFNDVLMEWMVIGRVRLDKQDKNAYSLAFRKIFQKCKEINPKYLEFLLGLVVDWSDAQIKGLQQVVGEEKADKLLKGCKVHWLRSCMRVADKVAASQYKTRERNLFVSIAKYI